MSVVRFIADLHIDHKTIHEKAGPLRGNCSSVEEHNEWIIEQWNSVVSKNDLTWVLGDASFTKEGLLLFKRMKGCKHLIFGNHDTHSIARYLEVFNKVHGFIKYKGFWLSHPPIDSKSLRGLKNIHGHTHSDKILNENHICVSVEALNGKPISFEEIKNLYGV